MEERDEQVQAPDDVVGAPIADVGIQLEGERQHEPTEDESFEDRRDAEQLGRPRTEQLREYQEQAPPAHPDAALGDV
jgi:hypothetical protein